MPAGLVSCLNLVDHWLAGMFSEFPRVCIWGFCAGILGLFLYAAASNQAEIGKLKREARACRSRLLDPALGDADFLRLTKLNLKVSLRLLARVMGPALLSALPILMVAFWMNAFYSNPGTIEGTLMENLPAWLSGWEAPFFSSVFIAALGMKWVFRLE
jgi:hypothetical protein